MSNNVGALFKEFSANKQELLSFHNGDASDAAINVLASELGNKLRIHVQDDAIIKEKLCVFYGQNAGKKSLKEDKSFKEDTSLTNVDDEFYNKWALVPGAIWCSGRMVIIPRGNELRKITPEGEIIY
jgi:hypothetical protein